MKAKRRSEKQTLSAPANAQLCVLCILPLICSYMLRRNFHPQGATPMLLKRNTIVTIITHVKGAGFS